MIVSRVIEGIHPQCKTSNECHMSVDDDRSFLVWAACGPYTSSDDLEYDPLLDLIEQVVLDVPDVVILCGPFVDARQSLAIGENGIGPSIVDDNGGASVVAEVSSHQRLSSGSRSHHYWPRCMNIILNLGHSSCSSPAWTTPLLTQSTPRPHSFEVVMAGMVDFVTLVFEMWR